MITGYYIYIEASYVRGRLPTDTARISTVQSLGLADTDRCIQWWYHMYGSSVGSLSLYLVPQTDNGTTPSLL